MNISRYSCERQNLSQRFVSNQEEAKRQYAHIYATRSRMLKPILIKTAMNLWNIGEESIVKLSDLKTSKKCCIIGTVFKQMSQQPSILKEVSDEFKFDSHKSEQNQFCSDNDQLILEDSCQRIVLVGEINVEKCYTGTLIAAYGMETSGGVFEVEKFTYAGFPQQEELKEKPEEDKFVMIVSGLKIGGKSENSLAIQLLLDYLVGALGSDQDAEFSSKIVHVIIAGDSISEQVLDNTSTNKNSYHNTKAEAASVNAMEDFDYFVSQVLPYVSVDIMPGKFDLGGHILPQKPLHPCLFPKSRQYLGSTLNLVSNPYECTIDGVKLMGTSGQNVNNMASFSKHNENIDILKDTLRARHIAPTAPDTLGCFPYTKNDPFIIESCPNVYFCSNQPKFSQEVVNSPEGQQIGFCCVPDFSRTGSVALVNLKDFTSREMNISFSFEGEVHNT